MTQTPVPPATPPLCPCPPPTTVVAVLPPNSGLAICSVVCGILGILCTFGILCSFVCCTGVFASISAIVLGHVAWSRMPRTSGYHGGHVLAITGIVLGWIGVLITLAEIVKLALLILLVVRALEGH